MAGLAQAVIRFLNRWRHGKQSFEDLSALHGALETVKEKSNDSPGRG
jgi:hypothetical protein